MDDSEKAISCEEPKQHQDNMLSLFTQINTELVGLLILSLRHRLILLQAALDLFSNGFV